MLKLLIADGMEEFRTALSEVLRGAFIVRTCHEGTQTLEVLKTFKPDAVVLDLTLPGLDGISLLQRMADMGLQPVVLATTRFASDYVLERITRQGVGFVMIKPCDVQAVAARMSEMTQRISLPEIGQPDTRTSASNILLTLGVPTKLRGYPYLREALLRSMKDPNQSVTKELYPAVAGACGATAIQVERSIRSAIQAAWENRDEQVWRMYFQPGPDGSIPRPTNATFISRLAECLTLSRAAGA